MPCRRSRSWRSASGEPALGCTAFIRNVKPGPSSSYICSSAVPSTRARIFGATASSTATIEATSSGSEVISWLRDPARLKRESRASSLGGRKRFIARPPGASTHEEKGHRDEQRNQDPARVCHVAEEGGHPHPLLFGDRLDHEVRPVPDVRVRAHHHRAARDRAEQPRRRFALPQEYGQVAALG